EALLPATPPATAVRSASAAAPSAPRHGRYDEWVLGAGVVSVAFAVVGTVFGVRALTLDPSGESTGPGVSLADLRSRAAGAHTAALVADLSFGLSLAAGATGATLYFGRVAEPGPRERVSAAWLGWSF